jgi:hypothetical protein
MNFAACNAVNNRRDFRFDFMVVVEAAGNSRREIATSLAAIIRDQRRSR